MSQEQDEDRPANQSQALCIHNLASDTKFSFKGGSIVAIKLTNFMCHESFEINFGPRVNFVIGPNGSGKSALLTGIVIALGGRATITNRAKRADEFVMFGKRTGKVTVTIHNYDKIMEKNQAFKPDDYGKFIVVERIISKDESGSRLNIKNDKGKKISERKQELDEMLEHFGILINNPICILNQEISKTFLHSKKPEDKFELFMKATNLEQIEEDYEVANKNHREWETCNEGKTLSYKMLDGEYGSCKEKLKFLENRANLRERQEALLQESVWAHVRDNEVISNEAREMLQKITNSIEECQKTINNRMKKIEQHDEDIKIMRSKIESLQDRVEETRKKMSDIRTAESNLQGLQINIKSRIGNHENKINRKNKDKQSLLRSIEELKEQFRNQNALDQDNEQRKLEIERLDKEEIPMLQAREKSIRLYSQQLNESMTSIRTDLHAANEKVSGLKGGIASSNTLLRRLKNGQDNQLRKYGDHIIKIREEIDLAQSQRRFKHKPIGPLGACLKLKSSEIALSLEHLLGRNAHAFACDNLEDMAILNSIFKKCTHSRENRIPAIITRKFGRRHDVSRWKAIHPIYKTMLDYLDIENDVVFNCLVDRCSLENVLFIPNYKDAESIMIDQSAVPKHTRCAYTSNCSVITPRTTNGGYKAFTNSTKSMILFLDSNINQINEVERELTRQNAELREAESVVRKFQESIETQRREYDRNTLELKSIIKESRDKEERLLTLRTTLAKEPQELSALEEELQSCVESIAHEENSIKKEKESLQQIEIELADKEKDKAGCRELMLTYEREKKDIQKCTDDSREFQRKAKDEIAGRKIKLANLNKEKEEQEKIFREATEEALRSTQGVSGSSIRPRKVRDTKKIKDDLNKIDIELRISEEDTRDPNEVMRIINKRIKEIEVINTLKDANLLNFQLSTKTLEQRKSGFKRLRDNTIHGVSATFSTVMRSMKMNGELRINLDPVIERGEEIKKGRTLEMRIDTNYEPTQRPTSSVMSDNALNTRLSRSQPAPSIDPPRPKRARTDRDRDSGASEKENGDKMTDTRSLSGGERSFSTVAFVLALWHHCHSPFKLMDEIDVFMDMVTRRTSYTALIRFAQLDEDPGQFIFFSPLELPTFDDSGNFVRVFEMPSIVRKRPFQDTQVGGSGDMMATTNGVSS